MDRNTSRRDLLSAAPAIVIGTAVLGLAPAAATLPTGNVSPELLALIGKFDATNAEIDRFYAEVFNPAIERANSMRAAIPHVTIPSAHPKSAGLWSTDNPAGLRLARRLVDAEGRGASDDVQCARKLLAAQHRRNRAEKRIDVITGARAAAEQEDELYVPYREARSAVHAFPVRTLADLQAKLAFIERDDGMDGEDLLPLMIADVARLAGGEA
ncbi:hypothetical protein [Sphingomonas sp. CCH5-D11]|uniref:hypothetical protein n=1 Tax=Sphingomonas sp. CCH5-D11 TaxID=1768786 RepID=UPI00083616F3|nr:hypothetical protein [Sphingomonas sp. CCH5-D11]